MPGAGDTGRDSGADDCRRDAADDPRPPGQPREPITVTVAAQVLFAIALMVAVLTIRPPRAIMIMPEGPPYHR